VRVNGVTGQDDSNSSRHFYICFSKAGCAVFLRKSKAAQLFVHLNV